MSTINPSVIVDIDGTIADPRARLHYINGEKKDWDLFHAECSHDKPIQETIDIVNGLARDNYKIILMTGRGGENRDATIAWLHRNSVRWHLLLMREPDNFEADVDLKLRWYHMLADGRISLPYTALPILAFEDRTRMVAAWRDLDLRVYQVDEGDF